MVLAFFDYVVYLYQNLRDKNGFYNYWYSLHINDFPVIMKEQRAKKEPEWIRKLRYILEFRQLFDLLFMVFLLVSIIFWIYYLVLANKILAETKTFKEDSEEDEDTKPEFAGDLNIMTDTI
mmetsp:Transcript_37535/g.33605  ORF Transcript_37535/g.33605 Transcript_37535/m.33605 type:complete len:121 (+) Transcript_37535:2912-3274(+)